MYKDARVFSNELKRLSKEAFPKEEVFGLRSQLWRALDSIILNIAEGSDRGTDKDFAHFLNQSHTSLNEVVACLDVALDNSYVSTEQHHTYLIKAAGLANQLTAFRTSILSKVKGQRSKVLNRGFTTIEIIVVIGISFIIISALLWFISTAYPISKTTYLQQRSTESARLQLKRISKILREARSSETGAYPLVTMDPQVIIFYSDVDADETVERIRYELDGTDLVRGVTEPTGTPLIYNPANEETTIVAAHVRNGTDDVFTYYTGDYPADQTPLTPVDLTEVKYIQFHLIIDADPNQDPPAVDILSQVSLRNLKTNLGETVEEE